MHPRTMCSIVSTSVPQAFPQMSLPLLRTESSPEVCLSQKNTPNRVIIPHFPPDLSFLCRIQVMGGLLWCRPQPSFFHIRNRVSEPLAVSVWHCLFEAYGLNRTGFATRRLAGATWAVVSCTRGTAGFPSPNRNLEDGIPVGHTDRPR